MRMGVGGLGVSNSQHSLGVSNTQHSLGVFSIQTVRPPEEMEAA